MQTLTIGDIKQSLDALADKTIYPLGTKIYRVLDTGLVLMDKVEAYRINIQGDDVDLIHVGGHNGAIPTPEDVRGGGYYGSCIKSWHFDRREANKAAAPFLEVENKKTVERNKERIAELQAENARLEK